MARSSEQDRLLATIQQIHAAGPDEGLWPQALKGITELIGGVGASLEVMSKPRCEVAAMYAFGLPGSDAAQYVEHYAPTCKRTLYGARQKTGAIIYESQFTDDEQIRTDPFYMEFLAHCDMRYFIGAAVLNDTYENVYVAVQRARSQDHVGPREIVLYQTLLPHVQQSYDVMRRLRGSQQHAQSLADALDWLEDGVLTLGEDGRILHANAAAEGILRRHDGVQAKSGFLDFTSAEARVAYQRALRSLADVNTDPASTGALDFVAGYRDGRARYLISLRPLGVAGPGQAAALLFLRDPLRKSQTSIHLLERAFDLTAAEARLAAALVEGVSPGEYARQHHVSANTVYVHLRNIKAKCGENRMVALIRRLHAASAPTRLTGETLDGPVTRPYPTSHNA